MRATTAKTIIGLLLSLSVVGMTVTAPSVGWAQGTERDKKRAKQYYQKGIDAFYNKKYSLAITYFRRANTHDPNPIFQYNISVTQAKLGNLEEALQAALRARRMAENDKKFPADIRTKNAGRIATYMVQLRARKVAYSLNPDRQPKAEDGQQDEDEKDSLASAGPSMEISPLGWSGVGVGGLGVGLVGAAMFVNFSLADDFSTARNTDDPAVFEDTQTSIESSQQTGQILLYSGAGLIAAGAGLLAYDLMSNSEGSKATAFVGAGPDGGTSVQFRLDF